MSENEWLTERSRNGGLDEVPVPSAGRLWLCGKHLVGPDPDAVLARTGAAAIVCLNEEVELIGRYPDYVAWLKANAGTHALWYPIHDMHAPEVDALSVFIDGLVARLDSGDGLVVHCGAGIGRAGTIAAAVLIAHGATVDDALRVIAASRPSAGPQTADQERVLSAYAEHLAAKS